MRGEVPKSTGSPGVGGAVRRLRARIALVSALACAIVLLAPSPPAPAAFPGANGKIAFQSYRDTGTNAQIYSLSPADPDISAVRLTNNTGFDGSPVWSPDGSKIAYWGTRTGNTEIYVMNADGTGDTNVTNSPGVTESEPAWSPDGTKIAFMGDEGSGNPQIWTMNANGTGRTRLTHNAAFDAQPVWSPDGTKIAFVRNLTYPSGNYDVYAMNANGTGETPLANGVQDDSTPDWSPDGQKIAWARAEKDPCCPSDPFAYLPAEIWVMNPDGSAKTRITFDSFQDFAPSWSPDGAKIAFDTNRDGNFEIYTMNAAGTGLTRITNNPASDNFPDWQALSQSGDLGVTKSDSPDPVEIGQRLTYTVRVRNNGPTAVAGATLTDDLPTSVTFVSATASQGTCTRSGSRVTCNLGTVAGRATATVVIDVTAPNEGPITNLASVSSSTFDPYSANDVDTEDTLVWTGYERPIGASPMRISLVPAFRACTVAGPPNASHAPPLSGRSCHDPIPASSMVAVGPQSLGFARQRVLAPGECAVQVPAACFPDVVLTANITDVRAASPVGLDYDPPGPGPDLTAVFTLPDYSGPAITGNGVQVTDRRNRLDSTPSGPYDQPATAIPLPFPVPIDCVATTDPLVGSTCDVKTSANSLVPGSAVAGSREIWELGQFQVLDPNNSAFEVQGVFIP